MRENGDARLHAFTLGFTRLARRKDRLCHRFFGLVGKAHVVELHLIEAKAHGFLRELRRVDPDGVVVRVHPGGTDPIAPQSTAVTILHRPLRPPLGEQRVLGYDDACDRVDVVRPERVEPRLHILRAHALGRADLLRDFDFGGIEQAARVVLHVDDERIDLRRICQPDELGQLARSKRPRVDVERLDRLERLGVEHRIGQDVAQLDAAQPHRLG